MNRRLTKFIVFALTILTAHLISDFIAEEVLEHIGSTNPYKQTAIRMLIALFVFFPTLMLAEKYLKSITRRYVSASKKVAGSSTGLLIGFAIALAVLYSLFLLLWYHRNILKDLFG